MAQVSILGSPGYDGESPRLDRCPPKNIGEGNTTEGGTQGFFIGPPLGVSHFATIWGAPFKGLGPH